MIVSVTICWISRRKIGDLRAVDALILELIQILPTDLHSPALSENSQRALHVSLVSIRSEVDSAEDSIAEPERDDSRVLELDDSLVRKVVDHCTHILHIADHPVEKVDEMTELRVQ